MVLKIPFFQPIACEEKAKKNWKKKKGRLERTRLGTTVIVISAGRKRIWYTLFEQKNVGKNVGTGRTRAKVEELEKKRYSWVLIFKTCKKCNQNEKSQRINAKMRMHVELIIKSAWHYANIARWWLIKLLSDLEIPKYQYST